MFLIIQYFRVSNLFEDTIKQFIEIKYHAYKAK